MGEAKRKRRLEQSEWIRLFSPDNPVRLAISRPSYRTETTRRYEPGMVLGFIDWMKHGRRTLCFNTACENVITKPPSVWMFLKTSNDNAIPPAALMACEQCGTKSDAEIVEIVRKGFDGFGISGEEKGHKKVMFEVVVTHTFDTGFPAAQIAVVGDPGDDVPGPAYAFYLMIRCGKLPQYTMFRSGVHNCHTLTHLLFQDLEILKMEGDDLLQHFVFKTGSSELLKGEKDPDGLHSWAELNGWVIDGAGGAQGQPILIQRAADYYAQRQITNVKPHEACVEKAEA